MKFSTTLRIISLLSLAATLTACPLKNNPRQVHEKAATWTASETPVDESVSAAAFATFDIKAAYAKLNSPDASEKSKDLLKDLSRIVLNGKFVENSKFRTAKMRELINVFHRAFLNVLDKKDSSEEVAKLKKQYYDTVNAGCSEDLRMGCNNISLFNEDAHFSRIMVRLAQEFDGPLETETAKFKKTADCIKDSELCRGLVLNRYRRLAMATGKRNAYMDQEYAFSYLKFARIFAELIELDKQASRPMSYLAQVHGKIFETIIMHYDPKNVSDGEFRKFVENFSPWTYSLKKADLFERGTKKMFEFGAKCCLYTNKEKTELSASLKEAIKTIQEKETDHLGESFYQKVMKIKERNPAIFKNLGIENEVGRLSDLNSSFYDEYFLVVDRLFRWHLRPEEINMILNNAPFERTKERLPRTIELYTKIYLIDMVLYTNEFMNKIYSRDIESNKLFNVVAAESTELTAKWHYIQAQSEQLERTMVGYFRARNAYSSKIDDASRLLKGFNRNIHYLSVFPNMIVMTYFLSKAHGSIEVPLPWRDTPLQINAGTVLTKFFDGDMKDAWYQFGIDVEQVSRPMLLYSFDYMLKTDSLGTFQNDRAKFYDQIFAKYMEDPIYKTRNKVMNLNRDVFGTGNFKSMRTVCDYEIGNGPAPGLRMPITDVVSYTYTGIGEKSFVNDSLMKTLGEPGDILATYGATIDSRITFVRSMIDIIEKDLERREQPVKDHAETKAAYDVLRQLQDLRMQLTRSFAGSDAHKYYFDCAIRLKEIERRRTNRLFEEERAHLSMIFDKLAPLTQIKDPAKLDEEVKKINLTYFRDAKNNYRIDEFDKTTYIMSKYDLLTRMKRRIMSNIFLNPTPAEKESFGNDARYFRPRYVTIDDVDKLDALLRDDMIQKRLSNPVTVTGNTEADRKAFIDLAMSNLNGQDSSYIKWHQEQKSADFEKYISNLLEFYYQGPQKDAEGTVYEVTARDVITAYVRAQASYGLDPSDVKNAQQFGSVGPRKPEFYLDRLFNGNGRPLAFFYNFMLEAIGRSGTMLGEVSQKMTPAAEAFDFAANEINLRTDAKRPDYAPGSFTFDPGQEVANSVRVKYGTRANAAFQRTYDLFKELKKLKEDLGDIANPNEQKALEWKLDPNELKRLTLPIYIVEGKPVTWYSSSADWTDETKLKDQNIMIEEFIRRTGNFYGTKETLVRETVK